MTGTKRIGNTVGTPRKRRRRATNAPFKRGDRWTIRYREPDGTHRRESYRTLRDAEAALRRATDRIEAAKAGRPIPQQVTTTEEKTLADVWAHWFAHRVKRTMDNDLDHWRAHLGPTFGHLRLTEVNHERVERFKSRLSTTHKPASIHHYLTLLISLLNESVKLGWMEKAPRLEKPKLPNRSGRDYKWLRTRAEIDRFLRAAREEPDRVVFPLYALAILTGLRKGELAGLRWEDVDLERRQIHVHRSYAGPTKSSDDRIVPLVDDAISLLTRWKLRSGHAYVFPNSFGTMLTESVRVFHSTVHRVLERAGFPRGYITLHSLRHTFASHYMIEGGDIYRLRDILGHSDVKITQRYAHLNPSAFVADYQRLSGVVPAETEATVLPMR